MAGLNVLEEVNVNNVSEEEVQVSHTGMTEG
jgi:hypothetical protein